MQHNTKNSTIRTTLAVEQAVRKPRLLFRIGIEFATVIIAATFIGTWFIINAPIFLYNQQETLAAFGDNATTSVQLTWTAPGDDGAIGQATLYDIRYSATAIDETTWANATPVLEPLTPQSAGATESYTVRGLAPNTKYYFAIKTKDDAGNWSAISNIAVKQTACTTAWSCGGWSTCTNGQQTRVCTDLNTCGITTDQPTEAQACTSGEEPPASEEPPLGGEGLVLQESFIVLGPNTGEKPTVRVVRQDGSAVSEFSAYSPDFLGGVRVAVGDLGSDGIDEIVVGPGPGAEPLVKVFTFQGRLIKEFLAYDRSFRGGVNVAIGNLDGKSGAEIITVPASKGGSNIRIFGYRNGTYTPTIKNFFAFPQRYRGSWNVAAADLDNNGKAEVIVIPGEATGGPYAKIFEYRGNKMSANILGTMVYAKSFRGGVSLAKADVNGDGLKEILVAPEARAASHVRLYGRKYDGSLKLLNPGFFAFQKSYTKGLAIAAGDFTYDGNDEFVVAVRSGDQAVVRVYRSDGRRILNEFTATPAERTNGIVSIGVGHFYPSK